MKKFALLSAAAIAVLALSACGTTQKKDCCGSCGGTCADKAKMGAVSGEKKECGKTCSGDKAAMGAVSGETKSCAKSCSGK
jgi:hypothetical protein